jgi:hypothetical protein
VRVAQKRREDKRKGKATNLARMPNPKWNEYAKILPFQKPHGLLRMPWEKRPIYDDQNWRVFASARLHTKTHCRRHGRTLEFTRRLMSPSTVRKKKRNKSTTGSRLIKVPAKIDRHLPCRKYDLDSQRNAGGGRGKDLEVVPAVAQRKISRREPVSCLRFDS